MKRVIKESFTTALALALLTGCSYGRVKYTEAPDGTIVTEITNMTPLFGKATSDGKAKITASSTTRAGVVNWWEIGIGDVREADMMTGPATMGEMFMKLYAENLALRGAVPAINGGLP